MWGFFRCNRPESITGKHVVITGGSEGVGLELARLCVERGAKTSILARTPSKLEQAKSSLTTAFRQAEVGTFAADVGDRATLTAAISAARMAFGPIDVCIACAGVTCTKYFEDISHEEFEQTMRVNYFGVVNVAKEVLPEMTSRNSGHFCAVSSLSAAVPFIGYSGYAPTKAAIRSFMDVLRNEFADTNVKIHVALPPDVNTPGYANEILSMPDETRHAFPECFHTLYDAQDTARNLLDDVLKGHYFARSPDVFGNMLASQAWGHYPRHWPLFEALVSPLFVFLKLVTMKFADRAVQKGAHHRR
eukprot:NODE_16695_length_982_cov_9.092398.p1 GENE.NODE_16695_length_982_cov_9.092398~~NODE_16695_length_982_cov_9.092398.p1  ORF type:complete len:304 (-),score=78.42 NODE_16695_length_982_cov_9.092398:28-939(-)